MAGNVRVANAVGTDNWSNEQANTLGPSRPASNSGHALAERAAWFTLAAAIVLVVWLGMRNVVARGVVAGSIAATVLFPYWILPGAGLIVIDVSLVRARIHRSMPTSG